MKALIENDKLDKIYNIMNSGNILLGFRMAEGLGVDRYELCELLINTYQMITTIDADPWKVWLIIGDYTIFINGNDNHWLRNDIKGSNIRGNREQIIDKMIKIERDNLIKT